MSGKKKIVWKFIIGAVVFAIAYLFMLVFGFLGVKYGVTNTAGIVDEETSYFQKSSDEVEAIQDKGSDGQDIKNKIHCKIVAINNLYPVNAQKISDSYAKNASDALALKMILAVSLRLRDDANFQQAIANCDSNPLMMIFNNVASKNQRNVFSWANENEWNVIREATLKDKDAINRAAQAADIEPRLIVASMIVEQLRLFHAGRELFKKFFEPLKILGNATKISLGVMGIKEATAIQIEENLKNPSSEYYLGKKYEHALDFTTNDIATERFARLTNEKDHYYSYLYGALYLKEFMAQWEKAGYPIRYRMEILGTLFNVGFPQSKPNANPKVGGSAIEIGDGKYSFGSLAYEFYYSGEMQDDFPYDVSKK